MYVYTYAQIPRSSLLIATLLSQLSCVQNYLSCFRSACTTAAPTFQNAATFCDVTLRLAKLEPGSQNTPSRRILRIQAAHHYAETSAAFLAWRCPLPSRYQHEKQLLFLGSRVRHPLVLHLRSVGSRLLQNWNGKQKANRSLPTFSLSHTAGLVLAVEGQDCLLSNSERLFFFHYESHNRSACGNATKALQATLPTLFPSGKP